MRLNEVILVKFAPSEIHPRDVGMVIEFVYEIFKYKILALYVI
jgi:hypothetical protein